MAKVVDFDSALADRQDPEEQKKLDEKFGEGGDVISVVGVANINGQDVAMARMVTSMEIMSFGPTIEVKHDQDKNVLFLSNDTLLLAVPWDDSIAAFAKAGEESGCFMFEAITPTKLMRALVRLDGKVEGNIERDIERDEYEKHLGGFYNGPLDRSGCPTSNLNKPFEC